MQNAVTFEMSLSNNRYFRRIYSIMDIVAELGGMFSAIGSITLLIITGLNYFGSYQFVMAELFYNSNRRFGSGVNNR